MNRRSQYRSGFTLTELLIAVVIIALLAGIAFPTYRWVVKSSESAACKTNLGQIGSAIGLYLSDNNLRLPDLVAGRESRNDNVPTVDSVLAEYTNSEDVFLCPGDHDGIGKRSGTSYIWNHLISGQKVIDLDFLGMQNDPMRTPILGDKEGFHEGEDVKANILYGDFHVEADVRFRTN